MKITNMFNETRSLKHDNLYIVESGIYNEEIINSPDSQKAIDKFLELYPNTKNIITATEIEFEKYFNINSIIEV